MAMRAFARSRMLLPLRSATPNSVTIKWTSLREVVTAEPASSCAGNPRYVPLAAVEGNCDDGLPALGPACPADKIDLAADAAELVAPDHLGVDLAHEVHLQRRVDGDHLVVLADDEGVVGVITGMHHHVGVAVDEVVELAGPHEEGGDELARVDRLLLCL